MIVACFIIIFIASFLLFYAYILYPFFIQRIAPKDSKDVVSMPKGDYPMIYVLMSVFNEEIVIRKKMESMIQLDYPKDRIKYYIGSDNSIDGTNSIVVEFQAKYPEMIHFYPIKKRSGKPNVVNFLANEVLSIKDLNPSETFFLLTDANIIPDPQCLNVMVSNFSDPSMAIVDAHMVHTGMKNKGISIPENQYISTEVKVKNAESRLWKKMAGPFGGFYLIRSEYFSPVPSNFLVDDFYIYLKVLEKGGLVINEVKAHCYEAVSHEIKEEYRRKTRISAGNYQNLSAFKDLWWPFWKMPAFMLWSHKGIRWFGPFLLIAILFSLIYLTFFTFTALASFVQWGLVTFVFVLVAVPIFDWLLSKLGAHFFVFRSIRYFVFMNIALLQGFINYLKGIRTNVWKPTKRD